MPQQDQNQYETATLFLEGTTMHQAVDIVMITDPEIAGIDNDVLPYKFALHQNYPNPFNPETWIPFELNQDSDVSLTIYDVAGRLVRHLDLGFQEAGTYLRIDQAIYWDGRTQSGEQVASGTYFYTLKTADYVSTQKMIILK